MKLSTHMIFWIKNSSSHNK